MSLNINEIPLSEIISSIKRFDGIIRKKELNIIKNIFIFPYNEKYITSFDDDAATINIGIDDYLLFATDGIWDKLIDKSPWWAGYAAVLSNINDIYAMGGDPIAMVDVLSSNNKKDIIDICKGIKFCSDLFNVPIVGGHTHPDSKSNSISISIIGKVNKNSLIRSDTAKSNEIIIEAIDLNGKRGPNSKYSWISTINKTKEYINKLYSSIKIIGNKKLVNSGKDISNPGIIGTIAMLCEASNIGALIDINKILVPDKLTSSIDFIEWLQTHPSSGFIFTTSMDKSNECIKILKESGFSTSIIGITNNTKIINIKNNKETKELFNFNKELVY